ncbi:GRB2-associated and regulator of MAPK protein 1 [Merluccius polli]|uniref:GRB2-associated and regulator of MAPK protein 1 n=1 Tax=Merluccius polli TaxID=89951 RepID=A0AA47MR50_MERPO|nr:GRB2-associated and regulator of MAPK protein 1 [Merluccius polli]
MDLGTMLYNNLKDVPWSNTSLPLDQLVSAYRLPQIVKLDNGESVEGLRDNDYLLLHSCRQWTTITAHSLEEGHYVIGPKIEIPVHYEGQFKLLEQDRDTKEPVQYFNSVEEVAKAFPERVYVMEDITFNVKMASGECNEDTEVYNITLSTGDELTLMGQAEILYAKTSKEKSRFNAIFKKIGKLHSISRIGRGKMPCLICMNHRTNESVSLPFQCKGHFSTCSPLELQMQEGEHTIRHIVEKTRLPVNVAVPSGPPRNQHDLHHIRQGHRYKLVNVQTKTVVVCCVLRSNKITPVHFPLHATMPRCSLPEGLLQGELWLDTMVHRWFTFCQEQFHIDDYSRAVRDVRTDWGDEGKSPKRSSGSAGSNGSGGSGSGAVSTNGCPAHGHVPSSLTYARDELTQSFHRLSVCVYGNNLHSNSEVNLQGCASLCGDWALLPSDSVPVEQADPADQYLAELMESSSPVLPLATKSQVPYEELWLDHLKSRMGKPSLSEGIRGGLNTGGGGAATVVQSYQATCSLGPIATSDLSLSPPPVPPKSEAVKEECRLLNAPPIPPRTSKQMPAGPITRSPSPTLSYYSSGLHNIGGCESEAKEPEEPSQACYPCSWAEAGPSEASATFTCGSLPLDGMSSRLSWPNSFSTTESQSSEDYLVHTCRSYYSYPRKRSLGAPKAASLFHLERREPSGGGNRLCSQKACTKSSSYTSETYTDKPMDAFNAKQSLSCPILPPRTSKTNAAKRGADAPLTTVSDRDKRTPKRPLSEYEQATQEIFTMAYSPTFDCQSLPQPAVQWQPPSDLAGLSIEEVSRSLRFIGLPDDVVSRFVSEKIDGNLLLQLTEEILSEDSKLSKLQVKKLMQFINGWRPKI